MFGADTPLVIDALQIAALALGTGVAGALLWRRRTRKAEPPSTTSSDSLEDRVRVLERIATDRPGDLADEIEALRHGDVTGPTTSRRHA